MRSYYAIAINVADSRIAEVKRLELMVDKLAVFRHSQDMYWPIKGHDADYVHMMIRERLGGKIIMPVRSKSESARLGSKEVRTIGLFRGLTNLFFKNDVHRMRPTSEMVNSVFKGVLGKIFDGHDPAV